MMTPPRPPQTCTSAQSWTQAEAQRSKYVDFRLHNNNAESHSSLLGVGGLKYACWGIQCLIIYSSLVCLSAFPPLFLGPLVPAESFEYFI